jgi:hypothetical protein
MSRFLPPDHSKGDEGTIGGYAAVHARPAALEGRDGMSYSVAILSDATGDAARPFGSYFLFPRWRKIGEEGVEGHLESAYLEYGDSRQAAVDALGAWTIARAQRVLDELIEADAVSNSPAGEDDA